MKWIDVLDIAIELAEQHPDVDPRYINFVNLHRMVTELDGFDDDPNRDQSFDRQQGGHERFPSSSVRSRASTGSLRAFLSSITSSQVCEIIMSR